MPAAETPADRMSMYAATLRRRWRFAVAIVAATVLAGVSVAALTPKSYDATAKVLIGQRAQIDALLGAADYTPDPERDVNTSIELITIEPVVHEVRRRLGLSLPPAALAGKVETGLDRNSNVVSITVRDDSPQQAARIANAFALAYQAFRARSARASIQDAVASAERRAARLDPGGERDALETELRQLQAAAAFQTGGVQVVRRATAASAVASGGLMSSAIVAGLLGIFLAAAAVVLLARTDKRLRGEADLEAHAGAPVLATVPNGGRPSGGAGASDALATLAMSLALRDRRSPNGRAARVFLLVSPGREEGATDVALGLARALADTGRRAIAIEADLREPAFAGRLGLPEAGGLTDVLDGSRTADQELVELGGSNGGPVRAWALPAGAPRPLPQPVLAGRRMATLVAEAHHNADVVLLAGAPAGVFGDSFALVPLADAILLVARLDVTRRDDAQRVVQALGDLGCPLVGAVATTGAPPRRATVEHETTQPSARPDLAWPRQADSEVTVP
jgi:polysaccharide biosynthesis transport protein